MESSVEILNVLKGNEALESIRIQVPVLLPSWGSASLDGIPGNSIKLLFLRKIDSNVYQVTDPHHPSLPGIPVSINSIDPFNNVASVECQVASSDSSTLNDRLDAIWSLDRVNAPCIVPTLRELDSERVPVLSLTSENELVKRGDTVSLNQAIIDALSTSVENPEYLRGNILHGIGEGKFDESAVPMLDELSKSDQVEARLAAARALKNIGTKRCVPSLRSLLGDSSGEVRYVAVIALADIYGMPKRHPSIPEFRKHEEKYTGYWK